MRADKAQIIHCFCVVRDELRKKYGEDASITIFGDGRVELVGGDLIEHEHHPKSIDDLIFHIVSKVDKKQRDMEIAKIYAEYPRKRDPEAARAAISKALTDAEIPVPTGDRPEFLRVAARLYARWCQINKKEQEWIPYPQTWFNRKSYLNAPGAVLSIMQQMKRGEVPKVKTSMFPSSWNESR